MDHNSAINALNEAFSQVYVDNINHVLNFPSNVTKSLAHIGIPFKVENDCCVVCGTNAIDLLGMMNATQYGNVKAFFDPPHVSGHVFCKIKLTESNSVIPFKPRESDVGYDLTLIKKHKELSKVCTLYDTGVQVEVPHGYYCEVVPRSSIIKTGHMMANSIGIIDRSYRGNIYIAIMKIDPDAMELELPFRGFQLILRPQVHGVFVQSDVNDTYRGNDGFGSSG